MKNDKRHTAPAEYNKQLSKRFFRYGIIGHAPTWINALLFCYLLIDDHWLYSLSGGRSAFENVLNYTFYITGIFNIIRFGVFLHRQNKGWRH